MKPIIINRINSRLRAGILGMLLASLAAGCSSEAELLPLPADNNPVPLQITGSGVSLEAQTATRAPLTSGSIGIFRTNANGYSPLYNLQYTYSSGWKPATAAATIYLDGRNATLCAYTPLGSVSFTSSSTTCTLSAQKYDSTKDMCYATTGGSAVCNKTPGATFAMKRAYSRLQLSIKRDAKNYVGNGLVSTVNLKNGTANFFASRTLDISSGTLGGTASSAGWLYALNATIAAGATSTAYNVLLPPQTVASGLTIVLTLDGVPRSVTIPAAKFTSGNLEAGKVYKINLEIIGVEVKPGSGAVTGDDFDSQGNTDYELKFCEVTVDDFGSQQNADFESKL